MAVAKQPKAQPTRLGVFYILSSMKGALRESRERRMDESGVKVAIEVARSRIQGGSVELGEVEWSSDDILDGPFDVESIVSVEEFPSTPSRRYCALLPRRGA